MTDKSAAYVANQVRKFIRQAGVSPTGRVRVINTDYTTDVQVDLRGVPNRSDVEDKINTLPSNPSFSFDIL